MDLEFYTKSLCMTVRNELKVLSDFGKVLPKSYKDNLYSACYYLEKKFISIMSQAEELGTKIVSSFEDLQRQVIRDTKQLVIDYEKAEREYKSTQKKNSQRRIFIEQDCFRTKFLKII